MLLILSKNIILSKKIIYRLNTSKLCEDLKERNINISDIHLLNIGKTPNLDIHVLRIASIGLDEIYKEAEEN